MGYDLLTEKLTQIQGNFRADETVISPLRMMAWQTKREPVLRLPDCPSNNIKQ